MRKVFLFAVMIALLGVSVCFADSTTTTTTTTPTTVPTTTTPFSSPIWDILSSNASALNVTEGGFYGVREHQVKDLTSLTVAQYQNPKYTWLKLDGDLGYAPNTALAAEVVYPLGNLQQLGITIPVVSQINVNVGYAFAWLYDVKGTRTNDDGPAITGSYTLKF